MNAKKKGRKDSAWPKEYLNSRTSAPGTSAPRLRRNADTAFSRKDVLAEIQRILKRDLQRDQPVRPDHRLLEDLQLDSLGLVVLATSLENHFLIHLMGEEATEVKTVGDLADFVLEQIRHR